MTCPNSRSIVFWTTEYDTPHTFRLTKPTVRYFKTTPGETLSSIILNTCPNIGDAWTHILQLIPFRLHRLGIETVCYHTFWTHRAALPLSFPKGPSLTDFLSYPPQLECDGSCGNKRGTLLVWTNHKRRDCVRLFPFNTLRCYILFDVTEATPMDVKPPKYFQNIVSKNGLQIYKYFY